MYLLSHHEDDQYKCTGNKHETHAQQIIQQVTDPEVIPN